MDLEKELLESQKKSAAKGGWRAPVASVGAHGLLIGLILFVSASATHKVDAEDKPIRAYITQGAAPPPPPPPPPPPAAASSSAPKSTPKPHFVKPVEIPKTTFVQPREIPKETPKVDLNAVPDPNAKDDEPATEAVDNGAVAGGVTGGVVGGIAGGVQGGTVGGEVGGVLGGQVGGVQGGQVGGVLGGQLGGTGTGKEGNGTGGVEAPVAPPPPPAPEAGPLRVGGDVKAPTVTRRVEPTYPEVARKARVAGVVVIEAVIDRHGNVDQVKVLKGLPMGLSAEAEAAVRQWKFRPGTLNGQPVDVIFSLTVNFTLGGDAVPSVKKATPVLPAAPAAPEPAPEAPAPAPETTSTQQ